MSLVLGQSHSREDCVHVLRFLSPVECVYLCVFVCSVVLKENRAPNALPTIVVDSSSKYASSVLPLSF
jgi:hypothetical protein